MGIRKVAKPVFKDFAKKNQNQKTRDQKKTLGAQMASHHQVATHHQGPMACLTGQIPKSKISLSSFHLISGAMLAFPPGKLPFAIWQTYPDPPQNPDHTLTAHIWIWGSPCTPLIRCLDTTMHGKPKSRKTSFSQTFQKIQIQKT